MNLFRTQQTTIGYSSIPDAIADNDETAAVGHRSSMWMGMMITFVAGMMLVAGGTVWMLPEESSYTTSAEGLVVATHLSTEEENDYEYEGEDYKYQHEGDYDYPYLNQCASNYGSITPCCGQGGGNVAFQYQCPKSRPICKNYIYGKSYGQCQVTPADCRLCGDQKSYCCNPGWNYHCDGCASSF